MKTRDDFLNLLEKVCKLPIGGFYAGDDSVPIPNSEDAEIYQRAVFDIPISGKKHVRFARNGVIRDQFLEPGDILFSAPGIWKCTEWEVPHELFCLVIGKDYLRITYVDGRDPDPDGRRPVCRDYLHTRQSPDSLILDSLRNLIRLDRNVADHAAAMFLTRSLLLLSRDFFQKDNSAHTLSKSERTWQMIMQYLSENFNADISRDDAANLFHLNPCYISRLFRKHGGKNFSAVLRDFRMEHAAYLLSFDNLLIDEIAMQCGYSSTQTFTTVFRQHFGLPPGKYRIYDHRRKQMQKR